MYATVQYLVFFYFPQENRSKKIKILKIVQLLPRNKFRLDFPFSVIGGGPELEQTRSEYYSTTCDIVRLPRTNVHALSVGFLSASFCNANL